MEIKTSIFYGTYDFEIKLDEYSSQSQNKSEFQITLGDKTLIVTRDEWNKLNNLVTNSMDFLEDNRDNG